MPSLDDRERMIGHVLRELPTGTYTKTFLVINFETHTILGYPGSVEVHTHTHTHTHTHIQNFATPTQSTKELDEEEPVLQINCQWITKVSNFR